MKNLLLVLVFTFSLFGQYEWSDPIELASKVTWPDAVYGPSAITVDKNGIIHTFWVKRIDLFNDDYSQIMHKTSSDGGLNWTETENLTPDYFESSIIGSLNVVCDSENNLHLMYLRGVEWDKVMYLKYDGAAWTEPVSIFDYAISQLKIAIDSNDRIYAVWYSGSEYYAYYEGGVWKTPEIINDSLTFGLSDLVIDRDNNLYACGHIGEVYFYRPFICKYDKSKEEWSEFEQISGFDENSLACALTISKNDTLNVNIAIGATTLENVNYNIKKKTDETLWTFPVHVNENTDRSTKDFYRDNDNNLHLFENSSNDSSLIHTVYSDGLWHKNVVQHDPENDFWKQSVYFDNTDQFYTIYEKIFYATNERAIFFQKKKIEVGIDVPDELFMIGYELYQNYPNPFNSETVINYSINETSNIEINIFNYKGELVYNLVNRKMNKGNYSSVLNTSNLSSGIYYYQLKAEGKVKDQKKMLYLK